MYKALILLFIANTSVSQQYDSVYIEKTKIDDNNSIYEVGKNFIFEYEIIINDSIRNLTKNSRNNFSLALTNNDSIHEQEVPLLIVKPKLFRRSNKNQTQAVYTFTNDSITYQGSTGIVENNINTWLHPPRFGFFKSLETCPFPYIKLSIGQDESWEDQMLIGDHYSNELWGVWNGNLLLKYEYTITDSAAIVTNLGQFDCKVIKATAKSEIGTSMLTSYYSSKYGFVKLEYTLFNGIKVNFVLKEIIDVQ